MKENGENKSAKGASKWFYRTAGGKAAGPVSEGKIRDLIAEGSITAQTEISSDEKEWHPAIECGNLGFDCMILSVRNGYEILGPFSREYMDRADLINGVSGGVLYVRVGAVTDVLRTDGQGPAGAVLVERVMAAEHALRESEKRRRELEAELSAQDLKFDAERQTLLASISSLKAEIVKAQAGIREYDERIAGLDETEKRLADAEAKMVDVENELASARKNADAQREESERVQSLLDEQVRKTRDAESEASGLKKRVEDGESRAAELNSRLASSETRCSGLLEESRARAEAVKELVGRLQEHVSSIVDDIVKELDEAAASEVPASGLVQIDEGSVVVVEDDAGTDVPENSETARTSAMAALEERAMQELMKISRADPGISPKKNPVKEGFSKWRRRR